MVDQNEKTFPFSAQFQGAILKQMLVDDVFMIKAAMHIKEEYFNNRQLAWAFRTIVRYFKDYGKSPSISILENEARKFDPDKQESYFTLLTEILNINDIDANYMRRELEAFVKRNIYLDGWNQAANLYNTKNAKDSWDTMQAHIDKLISVNLESDDIALFKDMDTYIEAEANSSLTSIPTGVTPIDEAMRGGLAKGTLSILLSATSAGKSMWLANVAKSAVEAGKKVIMVVHEDPRNPTMLRFFSCFSKIPYNKLLVPDLLTDNERARLKLIKETLDEHLIIKFMYGASVNIEDVYSWLKLKLKEFPADLFIDDYGQFIRSRQKFDAERFTQLAVHTQLKQMALELDIAVLTCAQGTRDAQKMNRRGVDWLRSTDLSEAFLIARLCDNILTLNRSDEQAKNNEMVIYLEKQRHGKRDIAVKCYTDYERCTTHEPGRMFEIDSVNPMLSDEVETKSGLEK